MIDHEAEGLASDVFPPSTRADVRIPRKRHGTRRNVAECTVLDHLSSIILLSFSLANFRMHGRIRQGELRGPRDLLCSSAPAVICMPVLASGWACGRTRTAKVLQSKWLVTGLLFTTLSVYKVSENRKSSRHLSPTYEMYVLLVGKDAEL